MSKVVELTDEEICCIETGLHYLSIYDKDFEYSNYITDLIFKIQNSKIYVGGNL